MLCYLCQKISRFRENFALSSRNTKFWIRWAKYLLQILLRMYILRFFFKIQGFRWPGITTLSTYRLFNTFEKFLFVIILFKNLNRNSTSQNCCFKKSMKCFDKTKGTFWKLLTCNSKWNSFLFFLFSAHKYKHKQAKKKKNAFKVSMFALKLSSNIWL